MSSGEETKTVQATCLCGTANHSITLPSSSFPLGAYICNCTSCRHTMGTLYLAVVFLEKSYQPAKSLLDKLTAFVFSPKITYYFCPNCGCQMMASVLNRSTGETSWAPTTGTLDKLDGNVEWLGHEHIQDTIDGGFSDFLHSVNDKALTRWPGAYEKGEELPLHCSSPDRPAEPKEDKLHAHCKCNNISFWISRPDPSNKEPPQEIPDMHPSDVSQIHSLNNKFLAGLCACTSCRLASGVEITAWAFIPETNISPWPPTSETLKRYQSSPGCNRYFCGTCGAIVCYETEKRMWLKDIAMGLLDAADGTRAESWFAWRTERVSSAEDAVGRAEGFIREVERGLGEWAKRR